MINFKFKLASHKVLVYSRATSNNKVACSDDFIENPGNQ